MDEAARHKLVWGWLRLFLGWTQMSLAVAGFGALLTVGLHEVMWPFVAGATMATITSRLLYRWWPDLMLGKNSSGVGVQ